MDGQSRTSDEAVERPLQVRYDQKMAKYGQVAAQKELRLTPAVFSHTGQIHEEFKTFAKEQIRAKFERFEGQVKSSKVKSHMNWWVKCISAVIAKTASRNVAFKARRLRESIMEGFLRPHIFTSLPNKYIQSEVANDVFTPSLVPINLV